MGKTLALSYAFTIFLGAGLLFALEPMFGKMALPVLGGSPAVWNTALAFYQIALLAGYAYAHLIVSRLGMRRSVGLHLTLVAVAFAALPIKLAPGFRPDLSSAPVVPLFGLLGASIGLPFVVLAATSPLLQAWFAALAGGRKADPYVLYAASNAGSFGALLLYPLAIEPFFGLGIQRAAWTVAYAVFALAMLGCAVPVWRANPRPESGQTARDGDPGWKERARWLGLAFVPSALMLGVTNFMSTVVAPIPLLWTLPLGLYLLTFVVAFGTDATALRERALRVRPYFVLPLVFTISLGLNLPFPWYLVLSLAAFAVLTLACNAELAVRRPAPARLTEFYLIVALGGSLGGCAVALLAPFVSPYVAEYPLAIVAACAIVGNRGAGRPGARVADFVLPAAVLAALVAVDRSLPGTFGVNAVERVAGAVATVLVFAFVRRNGRFALGIGALLVAGALAPNAAGSEIFRERNFFGVKTVLLDPSRTYHDFVHGATIHGLEAIDGARARTPLAYYWPGGPIGDIFALARVRRARSIAVVGLGIGSMACYVRPNQTWTFYEIDPAVAQLAQSPKLFSYLARCQPNARIVGGDARLSLAEAAGQNRDLMFLDAYSGDQLPVHLITREALALYRRTLAPNGILVFNVSSNYFDLRPVLADLANDSGYVAYQRSFVPRPAAAKEGAFSARFIAMSADATALSPLERSGWTPLTATHRFPLWTDDYSSLIRILGPG